MKLIIALALSLGLLGPPFGLIESSLQPDFPDPVELLDRVDANMGSDSRIVESRMVIHGRRNSRTVSSIGYNEGSDRSFTEYLSPAREKGTKMLKLEERLWIYSPTSDRIIQLSGHMLRQSVMGSDLSYEDLMEDRKLLDMYEVVVVKAEQINERPCWVLDLTAKVDDVNYARRKMWVDRERFVPLQEELFAKSGQLLKKTTMSGVVQMDGRWYPTQINFKDMLKSGKGTDFIVEEIKFDAAIPSHLFSKAALKK